MADIPYYGTGYLSSAWRVFRGRRTGHQRLQVRDLNLPEA
jgi:hypothetical protein